MGSLVAELAEKLSAATNSLDFDEQTMFLNTSANTVGIGTNAPASKLDVRGTMQVGVDGTGYDVKFFGDTSGRHMLWDESDDALLIGGAASDAIAGVTAGLQIEGTNANSSTISIWRNTNDTGPGQITLGSSRGTGVGADTIVQDNDELGAIVFAAADGVDRVSKAASISAMVGGTPGANDTPGELLFSTTADGAQSVTERMRILADGKVGIGTTAPASLLHVAGTVQVGIDGTGYDVKFFGDSGNSSYMEWDASADELEIRGIVATPGKLLLSTAEATVVDGNKLGQIDFQSPLHGSVGHDGRLVGASIWAEADNTFSSSVNATELVFATGASETAAEKVRITSDGKVGIGTTAPGQMLQVGSRSTPDNAGTIRLAQRQGGNNIDWDIGTGSSSVGGANDYFYIRADPTGGSPLTTMVINNTGNVGIGTTAPGGLLEIAGTGAGQLISRYATGGSGPTLYMRLSDHGTLGTHGAVDAADVLGTIAFQGSTGSAWINSSFIRGTADETFSGTASGGTLTFWTTDNTTTTVDERMRIDHNGYVGIGTTAPANLLHCHSADNTVGSLAGNIRVSTSDSYAIDKGGQIVLGGAYHNNGAVSMYGSIAGRKENGTDTNYAGYLQFGTRTHGGALAERMRIDSSGHVYPGADNTQDLGSASKRWKNIYTTDLHLANDRGNWTVIEEEDYLTLRNNKTDKVYKLVMEEIE